MADPRKEKLPDSALTSFLSSIGDQFLGPRPALLSAEASQLYRDKLRVEARAKMEAAEDADTHIDVYDDAVWTFMETLVERGVPLPPVEFYEQMIAVPTRPISELTAEDLSALPANVLQTALDLQRVREGAAAGRIEGEPEAAAKLPTVLVNRALSLVKGPHHKTRQVSESNFAVLQALVAVGPDGFVEPEILTEIGLGFNKRPGAFARRTILELREILEKNPREPELIITNRDRRAGAGPSSYTARFTLEDAKLRMPATALKSTAKAASSAKQSERADQVREVTLVDREQQILEVVLAAQAKGGATKEDLFKIPGVTPQVIFSVINRLSNKLEKLGQERIRNIGSPSEPHYAQASVSTEPAPAAAPADEVVPPADLGGQPSSEAEIATPVPLLTVEYLEEFPADAMLSSQELRFLAQRVAGHSGFEAVTAGNDDDQAMVRQIAQGVGASEDVRADNLAAKIAYFLEHLDQLDQLPQADAVVVSSALSLEADPGKLVQG